MMLKERWIGFISGGLVGMAIGMGLEHSLTHTRAYLRDYPQVYIGALLIIGMMFYLLQEEK